MDKRLISTTTKGGRCKQAGILDMKGNDSVRRVYHMHGCSPTLTTCEGGHRQPKILTWGDRVRKLTPRECARIQGFPDEYILPESNAQAYKQLGNAVTVSVSFVLAHTLLPYIRRNNVRQN
jgi:DNA (cytosine-5)-methyltransferase 1